MSTQTLDVRRRALESVLRPSDGPVCAHVDRAVDLALTYAWHVEPAHDGQWAADGVPRIYVPHALATDQDFASYGHEGGHAQDRRFRQRRQEDAAPGYRVSLEGEAVAWLWCMEQAAGPRWNRAMHARMLECLRSYTSVYHVNGRDFQLFEAVVAHSKELGRHVIYLHGAPPISPLLVPLMAEIQASSS